MSIFLHPGEALINQTINLTLVDPLQYLHDDLISRMFLQLLYLIRPHCDESQQQELTVYFQLVLLPILYEVI